MTAPWIGPALALFREACELPGEERGAFLDRACGEDAELRQHVEAMLAEDDRNGGTQDTATAPVAVRAALEGLLVDAASPGADAEAVPASIGGFRILRLIAQGGMGVVYEAEQEQPQRRVAIKVARTGRTTGEGARRFELEAQLLARLRHPGIAQVISAGTTGPEAGERPFFAMEFVEGLSLTDYASAHLQGAREKLELMVRVCEAVGFAHKHGVIHRDLKPQNVLIEANGAPKVLDFGVAKVEAAGGFGAATLRTEAGRIIGTLGYMAPEQLSGKTEGLEASADVYSLGVMTYELLSGRLPHEIDAVTLTRALAVVSNTDAPLLGVIRPEFRGDIEAVVAKALEKDPRYRYRDAAMLQADLERFLRNEPTLARPVGPVRRVTKWARRNPALATAVIGLFLAISSVAAVLFLKNQEVRTALDDYQRLEDAKVLQEAIATADELWPTRAAQLPALDAWLATSRSLVTRLPDHRAAVGRTQTPWQRATLATLVQDLEAFASADGLLGQVRRRRDLAAAIRAETVETRSEDWRAAISRIEARDSKYHGLSIEAQVGLIPLGRDPVSGLEEFLHFETHAGDLPPPGDGERIPIVFGPDTGIIFVLIPSGTCWIGAQNTDAAAPNYDKDAIGGWELCTEATVGSFFFSKYEMTQGQWARFVGTNPGANPQRPTKPVNLVSWIECTRTMKQLGLILPTEVQWEYAARAGSQDAYWTGPDATSLEDAENIFEKAAEAFVAAWFPKKANITAADWFDGDKQTRYDDGDTGPALVGSYRANAFGLFDVSGNVTEWCNTVARGNEGLPVPPGIIRGGHFKDGTRSARVAARIDVPTGVRADNVGLRPAMALPQ